MEGDGEDEDEGEEEEEQEGSGEDEEDEEERSDNEEEEEGMEDVEANDAEESGDETGIEEGGEPEKKIQKDKPRPLERDASVDMVDIMSTVLERDTSMGMSAHEVATPDGWSTTIRGVAANIVITIALPHPGTQDHEFTPSLAPTFITPNQRVVSPVRHTCPCLSRPLARPAVMANKFNFATL